MMLKPPCKPKKKSKEKFSLFSYITGSDISLGASKISLGMSMCMSDEYLDDQQKEWDRIAKVKKGLSHLFVYDDEYKRYVCSCCSYMTPTKEINWDTDQRKEPTFWERICENFS